MTFFDSDVLIDVYRELPTAMAGLARLSKQELFVSGFVHFELVQGCRSGEELRKVERLLRVFTTVWPSTPSMANALHDLGRLNLSHSVGVFDCLIAHTVIEQRATLYTFNLRHFAHFPGLDAQAPYTR